MILRLAFLLSIFNIDSHASINKFEAAKYKVKLVVDSPGFNLNFKNLQDKSKFVKFQPSLRGRVGFEFFLKDFIGIGYGFAQPQKSDVAAKKGSSGYDDWRFSLAYEKFHIFVNYLRYSGFYIENSADVDPTWNSSSPFLSAPNLKSKSISINFTWLKHPNRFSYIAALDQVHRQDESGGSWLWGGAITETDFSNAGAPIIPNSFQSQLGSDQTLTQGKFQAINAKLGYGHTWVWKKNWFVNGVIQLGFGLERKNYNISAGSKNGWGSSSKSDVLINLGYNGDLVSTGISLFADATSFQTDSIIIESSAWTIKFFAGRRF